MTTNTVSARPSTRLSRPSVTGPVVAALAGLAWLALGVESIARPDAEDYRNLLFLVPWTLTLGTLVLVHARQRHALPRWGRIGFAVLAAAMVGVIGLTLPLAFGADVAHFQYVVPVWVLAMAWYGWATARTGILPRWAGVAIALSEPLTIAAGVALSPWVSLVDSGSYSGAIAHGAVFLAIAAALRRA